MIEVLRCSHVLTAALGLALAGCFNPVGIESTGESTGGSTGQSTGQSGTSTGSASGSEGTGATDPPTTDPSSTTGDVSATGEPTTGEPARCGNGVVEGDEACDAGLDNGPAGLCTSKCRVAVCGDDEVCTACSPVEECDDGNTRSGDGCQSDCTMGVCGDGTADLNEECDPPGPGCTKRCTLATQLVFVTSMAYEGNLGGLAAADAICRKLGQEHFTPRREFIAWLSGDVEAVKLRLGATQYPFVRTDGMQVADSLDGLLGGVLSEPIDRTETGAAAQPIMGGKCGETSVWTGTLPEGTPSGSSCGDWTGNLDAATVGDFLATDNAWTVSAECMGCGMTALPLYCIERAMP